MTVTEDDDDDLFDWRGEDTPEEDPQVAEVRARHERARDSLRGPW